MQGEAHHTRLEGCLLGRTLEDEQPVVVHIETQDKSPATRAKTMGENMGGVASGVKHGRVTYGENMYKTCIKHAYESLPLRGGRTRLSERFGAFGRRLEDTAWSRV